MNPTTVAANMPGMPPPTTVNGSDPAVIVAGFPAAPQQPGGMPSPHPAGPEPTTPPKVKSKRRGELVLTGAGAIVATIASGQAMWRFFEVQLHVENFWLRIVVFTVFEIALVGAANRARKYFIKHGVRGKDGIAVWAMAAGTGVLAALDETTWPAQLARFLIPLTAAYSFERLIEGEHEDHQEATKGKPKRRRINWRVSPDRIMVALGLADATERDIADVDLTRGMARLATLRYRIDLAGNWSRGRATRRFQRAVTRANERYNLATNPRAVDMLRAGVALLHGAVTDTSAEAVGTASPWARASMREQRELNGGARRSAASASPRTRVTADVQMTTDPRAPHRVKVTPVAPAAGTRRSTEDTLAAYRELEVQHPGQTQPWYAKELGISPRRLLDVRKTDPNDREVPLA